jgi:drug/metabolite transporter (DMT)-like permease
MTRSPKSAVLGGIGAGTLAGLIWGLAFPLPELLDGWSPVAITAGRYLAYGGLSMVLFLVGGRGLRRLARQHWRLALVYAVAGNVGYYLLLVLGVDLVGAPITDIIIGCTPVLMAIAGNVIAPAYPWRTLVLPLMLVSGGLAIVNILEIGGAAPIEHTSTAMKVLGVLAASGGALAWTWYGLANARFLTQHQEISAVSWATVVGLSTGVVTLVAMPLAAATHQLSPTTPIGGSRPGVTELVVASLILGILLSWAGAGLWNHASARISPTAVGMLLNVETASGFTYVYLARDEWPPLGQVVGLVLVLIGVMLVVRQTTASAPYTDVASVDSSARGAPAASEPATSLGT